MPGLTSHKGASLAEAASVCFEQCGHKEEFDLSVTGGRKHSYRLRRPRVGPQAFRTYNDLQEATEDGAYAVAILVTREATGKQVLERSAKGTGFDYWIGENESSPVRFKTRLEVSGILRGTPEDVRRRVDEKCLQTRRSDSMGLDAIVFIVEFSLPLAGVAKR
jgi:hypothetical protein